MWFSDLRFPGKTGKKKQENKILKCQIADACSTSTFKQSLALRKFNSSGIPEYGDVRAHVWACRSLQEAPLRTGHGPAPATLLTRVIMKNLPREREIVSAT